MIKKRNMIVISAVLLILGLFLSLFFSAERKIEKSNGLALYGSDFSNGTHDLAARILNHDEEKVSTYSMVIEGDYIKDIGNKTLHLVIFRLNAQAYTVYFNGDYIATVGDMVTARSHIYNSPEDFSIPKDKIKDTNTLEIKVNSLYMVGLESTPMGIVDSETAREITSSLGFLTQGLTHIGIGVFLLGIIISFLMVILSDKKNLTLLYLMISIIFLAIYSLDFMNFAHLLIPYIVFKKIVIFSLFACIFFLGISFSKLFESTVSCIFSSVIFGIIALSMFFIWDPIIFKKIYDIFIPLISINFIIWIVIAAKNLREKDEAIIFLCSFTSLLIFAGLDGLQLIILGGPVSTSLVSYVLIFSLILVALLYTEISRRNLAIEHETRQSSHFYQQAITDPLTGAFNLKHTLNLLSLETPPYTLIMIDVDNFKNINDEFGHPAGDYILKYLVKKMFDEFRDTDIIGRYGGDEFIAILKGCSEKNAFDIMNRFRVHIEKDKIGFGHSTMNITVSVGIAHCTKNEKMDVVIKYADEALYRAKHNGKNQISI